MVVLIMERIFGLFSFVIFPARTDDGLGEYHKTFTLITTIWRQIPTIILFAIGFVGMEYEDEVTEIVIHVMKDMLYFTVMPHRNLPYV